MPRKPKNLPKVKFIIVKPVDDNPRNNLVLYTGRKIEWLPGRDVYHIDREPCTFSDYDSAEDYIKYVFSDEWRSLKIVQYIDW